MNRTYWMVAIVFWALLQGCGTSHHFLTPRPLEKGETMLSVECHFDLNQVHWVNPALSANLYYGAGKQINVGIGASPPTISLNHLTVSKYWDASGEDRWVGFCHVNQLMGLNANPYLEIGGAYSAWDGTSHHLMSAGLGLGTGLADPILDIRDIRPDVVRYPRQLRVIPFAKYAVSGRDVGFSLTYYHGLTSSAYERLVEIADKLNQPLVTIPGDEVDSISTEDSRGFGHAGRIAIFLKTGDSVQIATAPLMCGTGLFQCMMIGAPWLYEDWYLRRDIDLSRSDVGRLQPGGEEVTFDLQDMQKKATAGEDIVLSRFSREVNERFRRRSESVRLWNDFSMGVGYIRYQDD